MIVAIDAECINAAHGASTANPGGTMERYVGSLARVLSASPRSPVDKVVLLTSPANHPRLRPLRDERCDVVVVSRPLFQGRPVVDWTDLLTRHPKAGSDLLAAHQQEKLQIMVRTGASVIHFPTDAQELMEVDAAVVVSIHGDECGVPLSALLADALVVQSPEALSRIIELGSISPAKAFLAQVRYCEETVGSESQCDGKPGGVPAADDGGQCPPYLQDRAEPALIPTTVKVDKHLRTLADPRCLEALGDAYEHALASYQLRKAA